MHTTIWPAWPTTIMHWPLWFSTTVHLVTWLTTCTVYYPHALHSMVPPTVHLVAWLTDTTCIVHTNNSLTCTVHQHHAPLLMVLSHSPPSCIVHWHNLHCLHKQLFNLHSLPTPCITLCGSLPQSNDWHWHSSNWKQMYSIIYNTSDIGNNRDDISYILK